MIKKGQISLEVCVLIAVVAAALLAMHVYLRRAIQANWRTNTDSFSDGQYNPVNDEGMDPGESTEGFPEGFPAIIFEGSTINAQTLPAPHQPVRNLGTFNVASTYNAVLQIEGWHEED